MSLRPHASPLERAWHCTLWVICAMGLLFLVAPILAVIPLAFNAERYFTYPMPGFSLRWYNDFFTNPAWLLAIKNSFIVGFGATFLATLLGTLAALGLSLARFPLKSLILGVLISPMSVPIVITAVGVYFFYSRLGLTGSLLGLTLAHTALAMPFVIITVTASLVGFNTNLIRAAANLGANPAKAFFNVTMPLILPGLIAGALFAFATSFDELIIVLFIGTPEQYTVPMQMWTGLRDDVSPVILAAASMLVAISIALLTTLELLRRRSERLRGMRG